MFNDFGDVAFHATFVGGEGIFTTDRLLTQIGDTVDGTTIASFGIPSLIGFPSMNNSGGVVFWAELSSGSRAVHPHPILVRLRLATAE